MATLYVVFDETDREWRAPIRRGVHIVTLTSVHLPDRPEEVAQLAQHAAELLLKQLLPEDQSSVTAGDGLASHSHSPK